MTRLLPSLAHGLLLLAIGLFSQAAAPAATLYDGSLGTTPNSQGWTYFPDNGTFPFPPVSVTMAATTGGTNLQTLSPNTDRAGFFRSDQTLTRATGYTLNFNVRLDGESHDNTRRSGFSVIALSSDLQGIELSFWTNEIFAKESDIPTFSHAEGLAADTTMLRNYQLTIQGSGYSLTGTGLVSPLTGILRDYSADTTGVYDTPNFLFLGDNTTSAGADIFLGNVSLQAIPEPGTLLILLVLALSFGIAWKVRNARSTPSIMSEAIIPLPPEAPERENPYVAPQAKL